MIEKARAVLLRTGRRGMHAERIAADVGLLLMHEYGAVTGHWAALRERVAVARRARDVGELLRDQWDLLPETRARLRQDQRVREDLARRCWNSLRARSR